jgi:hypothetical protein
MSELIAYLPTVPPPIDYSLGNSVNEFAVQFVLTAPICVTAVGAFDHIQDGFTNDINVSLWLAGEDNTTLIDGSHTTFRGTSSDAGDLDGIFRWKSLDVPFELTGGTYFISTAGFGSNDQFPYFSGSNVAIQEGDDALDFTGVYNWGPHAESQPSFPTKYNGETGTYFLRGNFKFLIGDYDCTAQPVTPVKKPPVKKNPNRQGGKKGKRAGKKGKKV